MKRMRLDCKESGGIQIFILIPFLVFFILFMYMMYMTEKEVTSYMMDLKNGVDMANFASYKCVDQQNLNRSGEILFSSDDANNAYITFREYLIKNQKLDSNLKPTVTNGFIVDPMVIDEMDIYSVTKSGLITQYQYTKGSGSFTTVKSNYSGDVRAPNGCQVVRTSVYTRINFKITLFKKIPKYSGSLASFTAITN
jgi:hypothetical protein